MGSAGRDGGTGARLDEVLGRRGCSAGEESVEARLVRSRCFSSLFAVAAVDVSDDGSASSECRSAMVARSDGRRV